jgi:hypothetical protein
MRKVRRIGSPVRDSTGDGDLDEADALGGRVGEDISGSVEVETAGAPDAAFGEELEVEAAPFVVTEAVVERVVEGVEAEMPRAPVVGAVEEGAVVAAFGHMRKPRAPRSFDSIGR